MKSSVFKFLFCSALLGSLPAAAQDVAITFKGNKVNVKNEHRDSIQVDVQGTRVQVVSKFRDYEPEFLLKGKCEDGRLVMVTKGKAKVILDGLQLTSREGAPLWLKNKKRVKVVARNGSRNELCVEAITDTSTQKAAVIFSKDNVKLGGKGELRLLAKADGVKGINVKKNLTIDDLTLDVTTLGQNLGRDTTSFGFGGFDFGGGFPGFGGLREEGDTARHHRGPGFGGGFPGFNPDDMPEEMKAQFEEMRKRMEEAREKGEMPNFGGFPGGGFPGGGPGLGGPGGAPDGGAGFGGGFGGFGFGGGESGDPDEPGGFGGKERYMGKTKAIKAMGQVVINSGLVTVKTVSAGAEGIEGKQGVTINGGEIHVDAVDDAINANAPIIFNGGKVYAESHNNDAVDANYGSGMLGFGFGQPDNKPSDKKPGDPDPAIAIRGGEVYAWSHLGSPEEGLDCDFTPLEITGGTIFTLGGGMGEMPSVPDTTSAHQPTILLLGLNLKKGEKVQFREGDRTVYTFQAPMNYKNSASIVTHPSFQLGHTYSVLTKDGQREFTFSEAFVVVR